jgi:hypothetical protein
MSTPQVLVSRVPSRPVRREDDGSIAIDLWLRREGAFDSDVALCLTPAEAEVLHAQTDPATSLPDCRRCSHDAAALTRAEAHHARPVPRNAVVRHGSGCLRGP